MPSLRFLRAWLLSALALAVVAVQPAAAQAVGDAFTVRGVDVDVSAANPQAAKDQALAEGQNRAFHQLLDRLIQPADQSRLPKADGTQYVRDFSVDQERASATRYIATLTVRGPASTDSAEALRDMAIAGLGIIRVSAFMVRDAIAAGQLVPLLEAEHASEEVPVWAVTAPGRHRMPRIRAFVDFMAANAAE